jgi:hypothetical protein
LTNKTSINEKALLYRLQCPMRSNGSSTGPESPVLACAESTATWLIKEMQARRPPTASETREFFDARWKQTAYFQSRDTNPQKEYARRVMESLQACRRLRDIIWRCEILRPVTPYQFPIGEVLITGEYAVLRCSRRKKHAFALYLREGGVKLKPLVPDIVSFARRLDLGDRWTENPDWGVQSIGVMHYWVSRNFSAEHKPDRQFCIDVLHGAVGAVTGPAFPVPGDHCLTCPTRACRPDDLIYSGRPESLIQMQP